jgi:hypothetical protein
MNAIALNPAIDINVTNAGYVTADYEPPAPPTGAGTPMQSLGPVGFIWDTCTTSILNGGAPGYLGPTGNLAVNQTNEFIFLNNTTFGAFAGDFTSMIVNPVNGVIQ